MTAKASPFRKAASLVLAASFLFVTAPDLFGLHGCPYHGLGSDMAMASEVHIEAMLGAHHRAATAAPISPDHAEQGSGRPCTWLADCHACCVQASVRVDYPSAPFVGAVAQMDRRSTDAIGRPLGPRHHLFELHLPNAPPLFI